MGYGPTVWDMDLLYGIWTYCMGYGPTVWDISLRVLCSSVWVAGNPTSDMEVQEVQDKIEIEKYIVHCCHVE